MPHPEPEPEPEFHPAHPVTDLPSRPQGGAAVRDPDPPLDQLADDDDQLGWDRDTHGRMRDQDDDDDAVPTQPWQPS